MRRVSLRWQGHLSGWLWWPSCHRWTPGWNSLLGQRLREEGISGRLHRGGLIPELACWACRRLIARVKCKVGGVRNERVYSVSIFPHFGWFSFQWSKCWWINGLKINADFFFYFFGLNEGILICLCYFTDNKLCKWKLTPLLNFTFRPIGVISKSFKFLQDNYFLYPFLQKPILSYTRVSFGIK